MSDGLDDVGEALRQYGSENVIGYCFCHGKNLERAIGGGGLMPAYGELRDDDESKAQIARKIRATLEERGFFLEWNGDPSTRTTLPAFDWQRRGPGGADNSSLRSDTRTVILSSARRRHYRTDATVVGTCNWRYTFYGSDSQ